MSGLTQKAYGSCCQQSSPFLPFCNFSSHIADDAASHNVRHVLRNICVINLALNMLELHVIPERPVTTSAVFDSRLDGRLVGPSRRLSNTAAVGPSRRLVRTGLKPQGITLRTDLQFLRRYWA